MAKFSNDNNMDQLLNRIKSNAIQIVLCQGQPASYAEATTDLGSTVAGGGTARALGESTLGTGSFTGPVNGDVSGRKLTVDQVTGLNVDVTSTNADHVAIISSSTATELILVTTISSPQPVTSGNTATINAFDYEVADVT